MKLELGLETFNKLESAGDAFLPDNSGQCCLIKSPPNHRTMCESMHKGTLRLMHLDSEPLDNACICVPLFFFLNLWFHGVILSFCFFVFVLKPECVISRRMQLRYRLRQHGPQTAVNLLVLPFMASQFRHAPSCSVQLFITYDASNMISGEENNSSQPPLIYTPLHLTHMKIKIVCVEEPVPIWLTAESVF